MWELQARDLPYERKLTPKQEGLKQVRRDGREHEVRADRGARRRDLLRVHARPAIHRLLPRPSRPLHLPDQGLQGSLHRRRLLEGRREEPADAAHLWHRLLQQEGPGRLPAPAGRGQEAGPPQAGQGTGPVQHPGPRRARPDLLPSQGRHRQKAAGRLDAGPVHRARLFAGLHAARGARGSVEDFRPLQFLRREHVQADGAGRRRVPAQAHELPVPHPDLQGQAAQLSRSAGAAGRTGHGLPLRAFRRHARPDARARLHAGRRAHLLHARTRSRTRSSTASSSPRTCCKTFGFEDYEAELSTWDGGSQRQVRRHSRAVAARRERPASAPPNG